MREKGEAIFFMMNIKENHEHFALNWNYVENDEHVPKEE